MSSSGGESSRYLSAEDDDGSSDVGSGTMELHRLVARPAAGGGGGPGNAGGDSNGESRSLQYRVLSNRSSWASARSSISDGWRLSKSSVSSVYHSAQDISDLMSDSFSDLSRTSPHRSSFHSVFEDEQPPPDRMSTKVDCNLDNQDIFSSPQGSPIMPRKTGKSVAFQEVMPLSNVDFILVWDGAVEQATTEAAHKKRRIFEKNLEDEGLILEREKLEASNLNFVKIHAPIEVMRRYGEILKLRLPMKELDVDVVNELCPTIEEFEFQMPLGDFKRKGNALLAEVKSRLSMCTDYFRMNPTLFPPKDVRFTAIYSRDKAYLQVITLCNGLLFNESDPNLFSSTTRSRIVDFILRRKRFSEDMTDDFAFGIERLMNDSVYYASYPLHDGDLKCDGSQRYLLLTEWAALSKCLKLQPLDAIKEYFGVKIGLYFAWLGFYTHFLIPASIMGFICFVYGWVTMYDNQHSEDICKSDIEMCPLCDKLCSYWSLNDTCTYARLTYLFDNDATVFFAVLMSFWTVFFLEYWKRYAAEISHRWDLSGFDIQEEHPRPEYLARLKHIKRKELNVVTNTAEPYVPFWKMKLPYTMFSVSMIFLLISLAVVAVISVIIYRLSVLVSLSQLANDSASVHSWGLIFVNATAAFLNLIFIFFFNWLYSFLAVYLTELELHRTQTEFDDSLTLKMYMLQFVNYYASIFYIAFFKGKFVGAPNKYTKFLGWRQEECGPGGCMTELCIQLAIIMVGKQAMNTVLEMLWPLVIKWMNHLKIMAGISQEKSTVFGTQWAKDVKLLEWGPRSLFPEYLEMVLQFGFVTIFIAAFPLAPLFALLNNIMEMRLDAKKLLTYYRRPVEQRVKDIGVWYSILESVGKIAVISNAFIIAFTSNFIPKLVYRYGLYSHSDENYGTLQGFLEHSLASFHVDDLQGRPLSDVDNRTIEVCRYQAYRHSYNVDQEDLKYKRTDFYWKTWMARLAFIVVFENVVALCVILLGWIIPDVPKKLQDKMRRENYFTNEIIIKQEMFRARGGNVSGDSNPWTPYEPEDVDGSFSCSVSGVGRRQSAGSSGGSLRKRQYNAKNEPRRDSDNGEVMV